MDEAFEMCNHCGETFFKEDLIKGKCKRCIEGHNIMLFNEINHIEDE